MDNNIFNEDAEGRILDHLGAATEKTKLEMEPILNERANRELLSSMQHKETTQNAFANSDVAYSNASNNTDSNTKAHDKILVRTNATPSPRVGNSSQSSSYAEERPMNREFKEIGTPVYEENDPFTNRGTASTSTVLIVIASFVIIAMLIVICLTIMDSFGINLFNIGL